MSKDRKSLIAFGIAAVLSFAGFAVAAAIAAKNDSLAAAMWALPLFAIFIACSTCACVADARLRKDP